MYYSVTSKQICNKGSVVITNDTKNEQLLLPIKPFLQIFGELRTEALTPSIFLSHGLGPSHFLSLLINLKLPHTFFPMSNTHAVKFSRVFHIITRDKSLKLKTHNTFLPAPWAAWVPCWSNNNQKSVGYWFQTEKALCFVARRSAGQGAEEFGLYMQNIIYTHCK